MLVVEALKKPIISMVPFDLTFSSLYFHECIIGLVGSHVCICFLFFFLLIISLFKEHMIDGLWDVNSVGIQSFIVMSRRE